MKKKSTEKVISSVVVDKRKNPGKKNFTNRQRFIQRYKNRIKKYIEENIKNKNLEEIGNDVDVYIPQDDIEEPSIDYDRTTGDKNYPIIGNPGYSEGDLIEKPSGGGGGGRGNKASDKGEGEDDFVFVLNKEEFYDLLFEDLELPDMVKKTLKETTTHSYQRAGYTSYGTPSNLSVIETYKRSIGRRISLGRPSEKELEELRQKIDSCEDEEEKKRLLLEYEEKLEKVKRIPFFSDVDLRYRNYELRKTPSTKAVMFCIMDVSASMDEEKKTLAKKFFLLLYTFLKKKYTKVDIVFIRHHSVAEEVDEETFFTKKETGGTIVSSALKLTMDIIKERYSPSDYNIFIAQASDGDNYFSDNDLVYKIVTEELLPVVQYFAYIQLKPLSGMDIWSSYGRDSGMDLGSLYRKIMETNNKLQVKYVATSSDIWKVFKELFSKK